MGRMHRGNALRRWGLFQKCIDSFLMQAGLEEILQFRKCKVNIGSELDFQACPLFDRFLAEPAQPLQIHQVDVIKSDEPVGILHHECFGNHECVDFIRLSHANVILTHCGRFNRVKYTHIVMAGNKVSDKVVAIVCRRFKTDDDAVRAGKLKEMRLQQLEAITVICKFERLHEFFAIRRYGRCKVVAFGNVNAYINHEVVPPFHKV